jgi:Asp-tRNA(Asn)/Glu-tRNA(Gln) amidotransferase A subunit family amidase
MPSSHPSSIERSRAPRSRPRDQLRIAYSPRTPDGSLGHPDSVAALDDAMALCASLGHEMVEADLPGLTPQVGSAIGRVFDAATAWIVQYWIQRIGREPADDDLEPSTRAYWESGRRVSAADYLQAVEELQLWWNPAGLPMGVHFLGRFGAEATLFRLASLLEAARPWQGHVPAVSARHAGITKPRTLAPQCGSLAACVGITPQNALHGHGLPE